MKILTATQIREADAFTIAEENISSDQLMERASLVFTNWFLQHFSPIGTIWFFCGTGNNGGDGLCVARHLFQKGYSVQIVIVGDTSNASTDFNLNYNRLLKQGYDQFISFDPNAAYIIHEEEIIIDAIFGSGLNRKPVGNYALAIELINLSPAITVAIDLPSGLFADHTTVHPCVEADFTLSFELPKLAFFFPENHKYTGIWEVKTIGLSAKFIEQADTNYQYVDADELLPIIKSRHKYDHKGSYGHSLIIAGNPGTSGAAELSAYACLVTGSGLVTLSAGTDNSGFAELMTVDREEIMKHIRNNKYTALGIGPGLGTDIGELLENILREFNKPLVLDADALNMISVQPELLKLIPENSILTPHPKEYERLFGKFETEESRIENQIEMSVLQNLIIVYKRANSVITTPTGNVFFNSSGNPGMATAGSGDVLTGMITALLAQKYTPEQAAIQGVYLHGLAGDIALLETGGQNLVADDLVDYIPTAVEFLISA